jgi:hypothetical protein
MTKYYCIAIKGMEIAKSNQRNGKIAQLVVIKKRFHGNSLQPSPQGLSNL